MKNNPHILVIEDDHSLRESIVKYLIRNGFNTMEASSRQQALQTIRENHFDVLLVDITLPDGHGLELLESCGDEYRKRFIVLTGTGTIETAVKAMKQGAYDFLQKPINPELLLMTVKQAIEFQQTQEHFIQLKSEFSSLAGFDKFIVSSRVMKELIQLARQYAASDQPVLITGETGTGKELMAQAIQRSSPRKKSPFVSVNCASIPESLAESELFGYRQGAFTGAYKSYPGKFALAHQGTILLDEIAELPYPIQAKLLRVLESGEISPLKGERAMHVDVRLLALTNKNLHEEVNQQRFRSDLFYRIYGLNLHIPPLRERKEDIIPLATHFLHIASIANNKCLEGFSPEAEEILMNYPWPGNVRELKNTLFRIAVTTQENNIKPEHLPSSMMNFDISSSDKQTNWKLSRVEKEHIAKVLAQVNNNMKKGAELLGISRSSLYRKSRQFKLIHSKK